MRRCIGASGGYSGGQTDAGGEVALQRALADHLKISKVTVETAYAQLVAEGYIRSQEKVGYFVEAVEQGQAPAYRRALELPEAPRPVWEADFTANNLPAEAFPFPSGPSFSGRCFWTTERSFWGRCRQEAPMCSARPLRIICMDSAL